MEFAAGGVQVALDATAVEGHDALALVFGNCIIKELIGGQFVQKREKENHKKKLTRRAGADFRLPLAERG